MFQRAAFLSAAHGVDDFPPDTGMEVAFAGRSNAGKSSAINALVRRRRLAFSSRSPGRTQAINFYSLDGRRLLVDLPGYGYAAAPQRDRIVWAKLISTYLTSRKSLCGLILTMDIRTPLTERDRQLLAWIAVLEKPIHVLLTKVDKISYSHAAAALHSVKTALARDFPGCTSQLFSSTAGTGVDQARSIAAAWLK